MVLCRFTGARATDRRLKILTDAGYLSREKVLYGIPSVYSLTHKGKVLIQANKREDKIRIDHIPHDIAVLDTVCYFMRNHDLYTYNLTSEKDLHINDGFGVRKHRPDFDYLKDGVNCAVEIELTLKAKERLEKNIKENYLNYDQQIWVIPKSQAKIVRRIKDAQNTYDNIKILYLEDINDTRQS